MKTVNLTQGSPEWHAHRATHFNASDAPAMLGVSPYKTRAQLVREYATGVTAEVDDATQRRFDDGHRFEALARPLAEAIIGEDLYPCVGVSDLHPKLSASFDGLTLLQDVAFEHKTLNDTLRAVMVPSCVGADLSEYHRIQIEQQSIVADGARILFGASKWEGIELAEPARWCWYDPDPVLAARIVAGWQQFEADVLAYRAKEDVAPAPTGRAPGQLMPLVIEATGVVTRSNAEQWEAAVSAYLGNINRELITDQDFADADATVKWCATIESELEAVRARILSGSESIAEAVSLVGRVKEAVRQTRLPLSSLIQARKVSRCTEIVDKARAGVLEHYAGINAGMGPHAIFPPATLAAEIGTAIKGRKTIASISDAAESAAANLKIVASQQADRVRACVSVLGEVAGGYQPLFADRVQLCATKAPDDLRNLIATRIAEHDARERKRLDDERERIRAEEVEKLAREQAKKEQVAADSVHGSKPSSGVPDSGEVSDRVRHTTGSGSHEQSAGTLGGGGLTPAAATDIPQEALPPIKLGDINARLSPITITAAGLASLGIHPAKREAGAVIYAGADFVKICDALQAVLMRAAFAK
jgi:putative phage-type endonuclease